MHASQLFLLDPEIFRACGSARAVLVVERDDETIIIGGVWCWLCSRAVHRDYLVRGNPATLGGR